MEQSVDEDDGIKWGWKAAAVLVLVGPLALGVWLIAANPAERTDEPADFASFRGADAGEAARQADRPTGAGPEHARVRSAGGRSGDRLAGRARRAQHDRRPIVRPDAATYRADRGDADAADASSAAESKPQWKDPVRQKVLGQKTWMAKVPDAQRQAIDEEIERERPEPYQIDLDLRRTAIEATRGVVHGCYDRLLERLPTASGRLSVSFDLVADGEQARPYDVGIPALVELHDPGFKACVLDEVARISLPTEETGVLAVEYPFLFDEVPGQEALAPK
ncbi:MAG: hypothetical protein ACLFVJ_11320 [Persicimonas sp.]